MTSNPAATITLRDVHKTYRLGDGSTLAAANGVSLEILGGQFTALVGPSGSGKSTLLHLIGAIDQPDSGTITVDQLDITSLKKNALADYRSTIGFIFQQFHLIPALSLRDNVLAPLVGRKPRFNSQARAEELLDAVGLGDRSDALPSQLSGGQQQRVAIARALINEPSVLLADEPTGNLDSNTANAILRLLGDLRARYATTIVMATHDPGIARQADTTVAVKDGQLAATAS